MTAAPSRRGFALPVTIVMMAVVAIVVAAVGGFVSNAARQTRIHLARTRCRLAAQSALEQAKVEIQAGFSAYAGGSGAATVKIDPRQAEVYNWFDTVSADRRTIGAPAEKAITLMTRRTASTAAGSAWRSAATSSTRTTAASRSFRSWRRPPSPTRTGWR